MNTVCCFVAAAFAASVAIAATFEILFEAKAEREEKQESEDNGAMRDVW